MSTPGLSPARSAARPPSGRRRSLLAGTMAAAVALSSSWPARGSTYVEFFRAIDLDNERTVATLLQRGFDPNAMSESGQVGLYLALRGGAGNVVKVLLAHPDLKADIANESGETPLMIAALKGEVQAMRILIERGGQVNREGWTPLHYAASGSSVEAARLLVERGAALEARSPNGTTPLMMAARYGSEDIALYLLSRGASRMLTNQLGLDAAEFATRAGRESLAATLKSARQ